MKWSLTLPLVTDTTTVVTDTTNVVTDTTTAVSDHFIHNLIHVLERCNLFWFYAFWWTTWFYNSWLPTFDSL